MNRRQFMKGACVWTVAAPSLFSASLPHDRKWRALIIGHTGRGNYGHDLDMALTHRAEIEVAGVADPDESGRAKAMARSRAQQGFADYHEALRQTKPDLVIVAPRFSDSHFAMISAALNHGAHVYSEKPFTATAEEGRQLVALANSKKSKIAVAHQMRLAPGILKLKEAVDSGWLGQLLELRSWGKNDHRAGGEDLIVLGTHVFDLLRFFAGGNPTQCMAVVHDAGGPITRQSIKKSNEAVGRVAGDDITAHFYFKKGLVASFRSSKGLKNYSGHWGIELIGSERSARILLDIDPAIHYREYTNWKPEGRVEEWKRWPEDPLLKPELKKGVHEANHRVVNHWIESIQKDQEPICSGAAAVKTLEMVQAIYDSAEQKTAIPFPA